jgi:hypothetical protein
MECGVLVERDGGGGVVVAKYIAAAAAVVTALEKRKGFRARDGIAGAGRGIGLESFLLVWCYAS